MGSHPQCQATFHHEERRSSNCTYTKHQTPKLVRLLIQTSQNYRLPKIKVEPSIKLYCRMSNIDKDKILELEISDDETFGLHDEAGSPGKKRRVAEETVPEVVYSAERTVTLLTTSTVPITLPTKSVPEKLSFTQFIQSSYSSASRVNIYRSRVPMVYPKLATSETRLI
jgi:hypothetical protein